MRFFSLLLSNSVFLVSICAYNSFYSCIVLAQHTLLFLPFAVVLQSLLKLERFSYFQTTNFSFFIVSILFELPIFFPLHPTKRFNRIPSDSLFSPPLTVSFLQIFQHKLVKCLCILFLLHQVYRNP